MPERCANCDAVIGNLETPFLWNETVVCEGCHRKLSQRQHAPPTAVPRCICSVCGGLFPVASVYDDNGIITCKRCFAERSSAASLPQPTRPTRAKYNAANDTFTGTMTLLVKLAMRASQELGWKLENANENLGMVTFETGISWGSWSGVLCSLNIEEVTANQFRITGTGKQSVRGGQLIAINLGGEAKGKARKAIAKMQELAR